MEQGENLNPIELEGELSDEEAIAKLAEITEKGGDPNSDGKGVSSSQAGGDEPSIPLDESEIEVFKSVYGDFDENFFKEGDEVISDKKKALEKAFNAVAEKSKGSVVIEDEFIKNYVEAKKEEGFNVDSFVESLVKTKSLDDMEAKDFLRERYKKTRGYTDEDMDEYFSKKTKVDIDEAAIAEKARYKKEIEQNNMLAYQKKMEELKENLETQNKGVNIAVTKYVNETLKTGKFPLKFPDDMLEEIEDGIKESLSYELVKMPDGSVMATQKLFTDLRNNDILEQVAPFITLAKKGKLKDFLASQMSEIKDREFSKIKDQPGIGAGSSESSFNADSFFNQ